jgi:DNA replication protein DnaC
MLFFQVIARRYERASTMLTSNKGFEEWGEIFGDEVMAAALIDRLVHHCHIVNIRGNSYRMRHHAELRTVLQPRRSVPDRSPLKRRNPTQEVSAT